MPRGPSTRRQFSEPGLWQGTEAERGAFLGALGELGISARSGGRFLTLSFGATKAGRMAEIAARYGAKTVVALGDAPNDREMIEAATHGVIIRNDHGPGLPELAGEAEGRIRRTEAEGPAGWNAAILDLTAGLAPQES
ncbi:HAD hydrolase family protein [Mangrovicoccus ximenensis]|uniref:HAD hydrolase family protein n=1 Tax=Mangrovicoccus ximenensis TaxID=1911570 RepID=UPI002ED451D9